MNECFECGSLPTIQHHIVPRSQGGTKTLALCEKCHEKVHGRKMNIRELTKAAMDQKRLRKERIGTVPFGYTLSSNGINLIENPLEQKAIKLMVRLRKEGESYEFIAKTLAKNSIKTKKPGSAWAATTVRNLIVVHAKHLTERSRKELKAGSF